LTGGVGFAIRYIEQREEKRLNSSGAVQSLLVGQRTKLRAPYYRYESLPKTQHEPPPELAAVPLTRKGVIE
jgi:hypothetical protein